MSSAMTAASSVSTASTSGNYKFPPKSSKSSRFSTVTSTTTSRSRRHDDDEFSNLLKVYRKAFEQKVHQHSHYDTMTTHNPSSSPVSSHVAKSTTLVQPRYRDTGSYVQRWKALRDRNKNLPKLDWNTRSSGRAKQCSKLPAAYSRSYTYDNIQFPSLSNASVITKYSGGNKSVYSDNYRNDRRKDKDQDRKVNLQVLIHFSRWKLNTNQQREQCDSYKEMKGKKELNNTLSKSLPNSAADNSDVTVSVSGAATGATKFMYEKISKQKILSDRSHVTKEKDKNYDNKANEQTVQTKERENEHNHVQTTDEEKEQTVETNDREEKQTILQQITREGSEDGSSVVVKRKDNSSNKDGKTVASEFLEFQQSDESTGTESPNYLSTTT